MSPIGTVRQPLVGGSIVGVDIQEEFGLLSLGNGTRAGSASLLRNNWAITAAHCVEDVPRVPDPSRPGQNMLSPLGGITLTAGWGGGQTQVAIQVETFRPYDIALIRVANPFIVQGSATLYNRETFRDGQFPYWGEEVPVLIKVFGRGINVFATGEGATATPSVMDSQFRVGWAMTRRETSNLYWYPAEGGGMIAGGDSGGPSFAWVLGGYVLMGVHSQARTDCLASKACGEWKGPGPAPSTYDPWEWVARTPEAADAPVDPVWSQISAIIGPPPARPTLALEPPPPGFIGVFAQTPHDYQPFWLYAVQQDGVLLWHRKDSNASPWQGPTQVGSGWSGFQDVIPAGGNRFFALDNDGFLKWYAHDGFNDGSYQWTGPVTAGNDWRFQKIFGGSDGVVYAIRDDGTLLWYRHTATRVDQASAYAWKGPTTVGWGWGHFKDVFSTGKGKIYAVENDGDLWVYEHEGFETGEAR
jgi:hypothetical protein